VGCWWGKSLPSCIAFSRFERMVGHIGTAKGPTLVIGQQWGILDNELTLDPATLRE